MKKEIKTCKCECHNPMSNFEKCSMCEHHHEEELIQMNMKIGDKLYKYQGMSKFAEYVCTAIVDRLKLRQYEMECQSCNHGFKCRILVKKIRGKDLYEFLCMVNDPEEEWKAWHTDFGKIHELYYPTLLQSRKAVYENVIFSKKSDIKKCGDTANRLTKELEELEGHYKNIILTEQESSEECPECGRSGKHSNSCVTVE